MLILLARTIILYFLVILVMRLMGKRQIGELQPYEFVITIMISDLALLPMQDVKLPLLLGIVPILTLLLLKLGLSQLQLKSQFARKIIDGEPAILIYKSKIRYKTLKNQQINLDELMEELRLAGYFDLEEIQYAILETNGDISILPSSGSSSSGNQSTSSQTSEAQNSGNQSNSSQSSMDQDSGSQDSGSQNQNIDTQNSRTQSNASQNSGSQATKSPSSKGQTIETQKPSSQKDKTKKAKHKKTGDKNTKFQNTNTQKSGSQSTSSQSSETQTMSGTPSPNELFLPKILICDGKINKNNLTKVNKNSKWIQDKLNENGIDDMKKVLIAFFDTKGNFKYQLFDKYTKENNQNEK